MDERFVIPRTLDDPPLFFLWNFDEAVIVIACALLGSLIGKAMRLPSLGLGMLVARLLARVKSEGGRGLLVRAAYWYTPSDWWFPTITPSYRREYLGG